VKVFEESVKFTSKKINEFEESLEKMKQELKRSINNNWTSFKNELNSTKEQNMKISGMSEIMDALLDLKCRSMKQNLVFIGFSGETKNEEWKE
jgi:hypothetical protein